MRYLRFAVPVAFLATAPMSWVPVSAQQPPASSCATFNAASEPSSRFAPGEKLTVRGAGFGARSLVLVRFQQGTRGVELARAAANDLGAFRASVARIPQTVIAGKASITALDARGSAECAVTVTASAGQDEGGLGPLYVAWGAVLAAFGLFLAAVTYRRWKADRLREAVDRLARRDGDERETRAAVTRAAPLDTDELFAPPLLPEGADDGPVDGEPETSEVITRLRREVRAWMKPSDSVQKGRRS